MNVSSVKNLNGEVLSAVQDASLTNVIQTNSGNWQDITAYQNASSTYLTGVSIPESATWNEVSTTVQTNSAQWGQGGGGSDVQTNRIWFTRNYNGPDKIINNSNDNIDITFYANLDFEPEPIYLNGSEYYWNENHDGQFNWYCIGPTINSNNYVEGIPDEHYLIRINSVNWSEAKSAVIEGYGVKLYVDKVLFSADYNGNDSTLYGIDSYVNGNTKLISSFNITSHGLSASFESNGAEWINSYIANPILGDPNFSFNVMMSFTVESGSTVASSDVFPPTNNLDQNSTYYLGWNANSGGLFWYQPV